MKKEDIILDKKQRIMQAALSLFAIKTYHGTSISAIAKEAGVSKSLIYNYFESKDAMLSAIVVKEFIGLFSLYDFDLQNFNDDNFKRFVSQTFELLDEKPDFWKLLFSLMLQDGIMNIVAPQVMNQLEPFMQGLVKYFSLKGYKNPAAETQFFWALMDGLSMDYIMMGLDKKYCIQRVKDIYKLK
jgi:AcrR family transcriptional regulator